MKIIGLTFDNNSSTSQSSTLNKGPAVANGDGGSALIDYKVKEVNKSTESTYKSRVKPDNK